MHVKQTDNFSAGEVGRYGTHIQQQKPFRGGVYNYQSDAVPANQFGFNNYRVQNFKQPTWFAGRV